MAKQLTAVPLVSWILLGSGAAFGQVSSPDLAQLQGRLSQLDRQVSVLKSQVTRIATSSTHTVQNGDTLWGISRRYRVNFNELARLNGLSTVRPVIRVGQKIRLPSRAAPKQITPARQIIAYRNHAVAANETLTRIARRYGVSTTTLIQVNNLRNPNALRIGQLIRVPVYAAGTLRPQPQPQPEAKPKPKPKPKPKAKAKAYTPAPRKKSVPRQRTVPVPAPPRQPAQKYDLYIAQPDDTTQSIAKTYGITVAELLRLNKRSSSPKYQPRDGDLLVVPTDGTWYDPSTNKSAAPPKRSTAGQRLTPERAPAAAGSMAIHPVKPNDTLAKLAQRFGTTVEQIKLDNPKIKRDSDLRVGTDLRIRRR